MSTDNPSLYELGDALSKAFAAVDALLSENGGEYTDEMAALIDGAQEAFDSKVERVALYCRSLAVLAEAITAEERRLAQRRGALMKRGEWLRSVYLKQALEARGTREVRGTLATVRIQASQPSVSTSLPLEFLDPEWVRRSEPTLSLDKEALQAARRAGRALPPEIVFTTGSSVRIV